ncbi:flagellar motor protein MotD [Thauera sp. CAU 1555]|uniref:Flagellar motor protein MotD n=1 Tax=Thauera sedimentorum TaxID=2767595 RepID=A0ABR9BGV7_9RHOO|nr:flagellar motor protein MotD [Thauera sedimentorum]MBC9073806.1 flagellar motor protein MotD [Thauera sedimentorum]MBD8504725.1 flagellar motor protein MotD [Thauera sedimentorum]
MGRRRKAEEEHENHERWLVSYADFITLLFAFFVVMYSLSSINEGKYRVLSDSLMQAFRSGAILEGAQQVTEPAVISGSVVPPIARKTPEQVQEEQRRRDIAKRMNNMADEIRRVLGPLTRDGQVTVTEGAHGITVEINASALFPPGEATLGSEAVSALQAVAGVLAAATFSITIEGHTDNVPINTFRFPSNWELSAVRASSVVRLFVESGVNPERLTAAGYADQRPVAPNSTEDGRARNRRVTILIESMIAEPPPGTAPGRIRPDDPIRSVLPETPPGDTILEP